MGRQVALYAVLAVIALLAFLTVYVMVTHGIDVLVILSLVILAMFAFGIVWALTQPPDER